MLYKLGSLLGQPNSEFILYTFAQFEEGKDLLKLLQKYLLSEES
jgi:hypothetical protein